MAKVIYVHGLGGSGNGSSARNIKKMLGEEHEFSAGTYDLLNPAAAFNRIMEDAKSADIVIASSLGAFYAASLPLEKTMLLLNPCLEPENVIKGILYPEDAAKFDKEKCNREWLKIKGGWKDFGKELCAKRFAVFSDKDELFSFWQTFTDFFGCGSSVENSPGENSPGENTTGKNKSGENSAMIHGTHQIAKDDAQLAQALELFKEYCDNTCKKR